MPETLTYCTVQQADEYWQARGGGDWAGLDTEVKEAALVKASEWIDGVYQFVGVKKSKEQVLQWPRYNAVDNNNFLQDGIPAELTRATAWLAMYAKDAEIDPPADRGGLIERVKAGSVEVQWSSSAPAGKVFKHVSRMLQSITVGSGSTVKLVRV